MRVELEYNSTVFGECPSDYDFKSIQNSAEIEFLKRTDLLQGVLTRLKYNIEMFDYFFNLYLLNRVIKEEFRGFFTIFLSNLTMLIAIDFSSVLKNSELKFKCYETFCENNSSLFNYANFEDLKKHFEDDFNEAVKQYNAYFDIPRKKLFAHMDNTLLDQKLVDEIIEKVDVAKMSSLLKILMKILSEFWFAYNGKILCFEAKQGDDYKKLALTICSAYGDIKFL